MQISIYEHENGMVPVFFRRMWENQRSSDPYGNKLEHDRLVLRMQASVIVAGAFVLVTIASWTLPAQFNTLLLRVCLSAATFVAIIIALYFVAREGKFYQHYTAFYQNIDELFEAFSIRPSAEIGVMSHEQFRQAAEGELKKCAGELDRLDGFTKISARRKFDRMHAAALKWDLCEAKYDKYFPTKEKLRATSSSYGL